MQQALDKFNRLTSYDVSLFLVRVDLFYTINHPKIIGYFNSSIVQADKDSFDMLNFMSKECQKIIQLYRLHKNNFNRFDDWELLEVIETVGVKLKTATRASKYLRSVKSYNGFNNKLEVDYDVQQFQTLEGVSKDIVGSQDFDNDWIQIALRNQLKEEDFNLLKSDNTIKLQAENIRSIFLNSVIDNLYGKRLYGLDINKKITFIDNDIEVLSHENTAKQSLQILIELNKGDVPEYPYLGKDKIVGSNNGTLSFRIPSIMRQMNEVFSTDDSFTDFRITKMDNVGEVFEIEFEVDTIYNQTFNSTLSIR